jgi:hypothetical protein
MLHTARKALGVVAVAAVAAAGLVTTTGAGAAPATSRALWPSPRPLPE